MSDPDLYSWAEVSDWPQWDEATVKPTLSTVSLDVGDGPVEYALDLSQYRHRSLPSLRDTVVANELADDALYRSEAAWDRYAYSWHHGAGGKDHDFGETPDQFRFKVCSGIDPWTPYQLTLNRRLMPDTNQAMRLHDCLWAANLYFYVVDNVGNKVYTGRAGTPGNWSDPHSGQSGTAQCVESFGYRVYLGTSTKIQYYNFVGGGFAWTDLVTSPVKSWQMLRFAGGRFFGFTADGIMYEISSGGTATSVYQPIQGASGSFTWTCCFSLGSRIYAGGNDAAVSHLWSFEADSTGTLYKGNEAADLPRGELLYCASTVGGFALIGTNKGIRLVRPSADGTLEYGPLIGTIDGEAVTYTDIVIDGRWAYATGTDYLTREGCLIRIDLDTFVSPLAPAWCHDLALRGANASLVAGLGGKRRLAVRPGTSSTGGRRQLLTGCLLGATYYPASGCPDEFFTPDGTVTATYPYDEYGQIISSRVFFGTTEEKRLHSVQLVLDPLASAQGYEILVEDERDFTVNDGEEFYDGVTPLRGSVLDLHSETVNLARVTIGLEAPGGADTPTVRRWRLRGFPVVPPVEEWMLPLIVRTDVTVGAGQGQRRAQNVGELLADLRTAWIDKRPVVYREGQYVDSDGVEQAVEHRVRIEDFVVGEPKWQAGALQATVMVRLLSI